VFSKFGEARAWEVSESMVVVSSEEEKSGWDEEVVERGRSSGAVPVVPGPVLALAGGSMAGELVEMMRGGLLQDISSLFNVESEVGYKRSAPWVTFEGENAPAPGAMTGIEPGRSWWT